jgi:hypothetical protein
MGGGGWQASELGLMMIQQEHIAAKMSVSLGTLYSMTQTSAHVKILLDVCQREALDGHKSECLKLTAQYLAQGTMHMINFRNHILTGHRTLLAAPLRTGMQADF